MKGSKTWSQARSSCENRGGELLRVINSPIKVYLKNITRERNTSNFTWWLAEGIQEKYQEPTMDFQSSFNTKNTIVSSHTTRSRLKRSVDAMALNIGNINNLLQEADKELLRMETEAGEPTNDNRDKFIQYLLEATKKLTSTFVSQNNDTVSHIINCSAAILLLSVKKCDIQTNPNPTSLFEQVFEIFRTVSLLLGSATSRSTVIRHPTGNIYQSSHTPAELGNIVLGSEEDGEFIKFPSYASLQSQLGKYSTVITQIVTLSVNPHPSDNISGIVCNLLLSDGVSDIKLENLTEMIEIFMRRPNAPSLINSTIVLDENINALITINVSNPNMTIFFSVEPSANVSLVLMLSQGSPPNSTYFTNTIILSKTGGYRWMITPDMLQQTPGVWYIDTRLNSTWEPGLTLRITSFMSECLYWDVKRQMWSTDGCQVGEKSTPEQTQCLCNHLTLFGSSFFVMPNYVDITRTKELFATVSNNYVVLALLCAFFGLYLVTLLWACYADRRSRFKRKITLLEDNHPGAQYNYLISVQTGHRKNAGTSANVTVKLIGSAGESDTHNLTDPDKPVFERGAVDMFLLATPFPLGEVRNLRLQHDNSGGHPSWYINKVTIQDLQTQHVFHFLCECWMSSDHGDGITKKTFNAARKNEIASFRNIFQSRTSTGFRDEHIWVSIVDPPSRSPFTRAQRVSCCMSLLLCTMAINIAFWNIPIDEDSTDTEEMISLVSSSQRNKMSEMYRLESIAYLCPALDRVHEFIHLMQGETESDPHWVYCSKFLLAGLCHLLMCLEKLDVKNFQSPHDYYQALNITNLLVRKAEMVFSSHLAYCPPPVKKKKKRSADCWLPWWCVFLGWFLLLSISGVSTFFTLLYSFQYGKEKSIKWVMSLGLSLFESIFILQPLKVIGVAVFFALLLKPVAVEETEEIEQVLLGFPLAEKLLCNGDSE
ncbi:hypothetical protein PAMP_000438 [Pampus punctatissimus]